MTRLYLAAAGIALLASSVAYLRWDAVQDERADRARIQAEQEIKDRRKIDEAVIDNRNSGGHFTERLCAAVPERCSGLR